MYDRQELDIHPDFQRLYRWTSRQKVNFVESVLMRIPLPGVYVAQRPDAVWDVIDGLQRLSVIFEFAGILRDKNGQIRPPLRLTATEAIPELEGLYYDDRFGSPALLKEQQIDFRRQKIDVKIILNESDQEAKFDLFTRLNTGGTPLSPQEVRIAVILMRNSSFFGFLEELVSDERFKAVLSLSSREQEERLDSELALRWILLRRLADNDIAAIRDDEDALSNRRLLNLLGDSDLEYDTEEEIFRRVFADVAQSLGPAGLRKSTDGELDLGLFDGIAVALGRRKSWEMDQIGTARVALLASDSSKQSVAKRLAVGTEAIQSA